LRKQRKEGEMFARQKTVVFLERAKGSEKAPVKTGKE